MSIGGGSRRDFMSGTVAGLAAAFGPIRHASASARLAPMQLDSPDSNKNRPGYSVRLFGARGDGKTIDTAAVNSAIDAAAGAGGGVVHFSAGTYACHSIHLKSKVALYLDPGAVILAAD